jgi:hypothetical protein
MKLKIFLLLLMTLFLPFFVAQSQIDSVIVEKYYISDAKDATDTDGGGLEEGSVTYRVFVDLVPGSKLLRIYGDAAHTFSISSTEEFFNQLDRGKSTGKEIASNRLKQNTLALDTWITSGFASNSHFGVLKTEDTNGSVIGGINNDGGSAGIVGGLLVNSDPSAGIELTSQDGMVPAITTPGNWLIQLNGVTLSSVNDTSIFGNFKPGRHFITGNFSLSSSGVSGPTVSNRILVAQLTTKGELSFKLNVEIEEQNGPGINVVKYVADNPTGAEKTNRFLTYPTPPPPLPLCGCKDPAYLEYDKALECHEEDSCKTIIVFGCTDPIACNYNPNANFNIPFMCCYPGHCNDRDIRVVCPDIQNNDLSFTIYPNPARDHMTIEILNGNQNDIYCSIYNSYGSTLLTEDLGYVMENMVHQMNVSCLPKGLYLLRVYSRDRSMTKSFIKE